MKRIYTLLLFAMAPIFAMSQATTLFISEVAEGSSNNKYLEIYNGTGIAVDLTLYSLSSCSNGCDVTNEFDFPDTHIFPAATMLADGDVYIIAHPSADPAILAVADETFSFLSNGDDAFALTLVGATASNYVIVDLIGSMGPDIGTAWRVGSTTIGTQNHTLVRKPTTCIGNPTDTLSFGIDDATSEWIVLPSNDWTNLNAHTSACATGCNTFGATTQVACGSYTGPSGTVFNSTGNFLDTIPNAAACDSIIAIDLTINPIYDITAVDSACVGTTYVFGTQSLITGGSYSETFQSVNSCDSVVNLTLSFITEYIVDATATICDNESYILGTQTLTTAGPHSETFASAGGCDSTVNLVLTVIPTSFATIDPVVCDSYTSPSGSVWTSSNTYMDTIPNSLGCDSIITINLTINTSTSSSMSEVACDSYTLNGTTYTSTGVFTQVIANAAGCDSTITLTLDITPTPGIPILSLDTIYCDGETPLDMTATSNTSFEALIISGVADATLTGGLPKCIEFYANEDIADLSIYGFGSANNGGGTDGQEYTFPTMALSAGSFYRVATDSANFMTFYGIFPNDVASFAANVNGDDAIELFKNGNVIDVLGDINVDGNGTPWEYLDGWAYRNSNSNTNGGVWNVSDWSFSGANALDGASDNATSGSPFPIGTYSYTAPTSTITWYTDATLLNVFGTGSPVTPNGTTQTYYVTETFTGGSVCTSDSAIVNITFNAPVTPDFTIITDICSGAALSPLPTSSNDGFNGTWSPALDNTATTTYVFTPGASECAVSTSHTIAVNPLPTVTFSVLADICVNYAAITLTEGAPANGTYSGTGVTAGSFDPAIAGVGTHTLTYEFTDGTGCTGSATSDIVVDACASIKEINVNAVNVYPNPTKEAVTVSFNGEEASIIVMDVKGQVLITERIVSNETVNMNNLSSGTYFVKVTIEGNTFTQRVIVE